MALTSVEQAVTRLFRAMAIVQITLQHGPPPVAMESSLSNLEKSLSLLRSQLASCNPMESLCRPGLGLHPEVAQMLAEGLIPKDLTVPDSWEE